MTLYLKYRPQTFDDLDLTSVRESLKKIIAGPIPHAFLLIGPRGTGKTSAARIIAKAINCEDRGKSIEPCNKCDTCISISKGTNVDVVEMDAASHRGIDDIRSLREAVKLAPARAKKKVYIVDEAHMLTVEASNALLKTLEEPPSHVVFILATTNPEKLIQTIHSRVTTINFAKATREETIRSLSKVAKGEGIQIDKNTLTEICIYSDGSFRDAVKTLEQIVSEGVELSTGGVKNYLSGTSDFDENKFLKLLCDKNLTAALTVLDDAVSKGASAKNITLSLIMLLRNEIINIITTKKNNLDLDQYQISELIQLLTDSLHDIPVSTLEQIPLELALVRWCNYGDDKKLKLAQKKSDENGVENKNLEDKKVPKDNGDVIGKTDQETKESVSISTDTSVNSVSLENIGIDQSAWTKILVSVRVKNASTEALLRATQPLSYDGKIVTIGVYYSFHKERLESNPHRILLEDTLSSTFGSNIRVICKLISPPAKSEITESQPLTSASSINPPSLQSTQTGHGLVLTEDKDDDIVKIAEKIFS